MLGYNEIVNLLLANGATVQVRNAQGWTPLREAVSRGDRQLIGGLLRKLKQQSRDTMQGRRPDLLNMLSAIGDFYMELKWDFQSWIPLVSRILPSDTCRIQKRGNSIRMDTTLIDFQDMKWERGDITFLLQGNCQPGKMVVVLDNTQKVFQMVRYPESEAELEDEIDMLMSTDILSAHFSTKNVTFSRVQTGWLLRESRTEKVSRFLADFYHVHGLEFEWRKRREHLSEQDLINQKAMVDSIKGGKTSALAEIEHPTRRESLPPPPPCTLTWDDYINNNNNEDAPILGRTPVCKYTRKSFKAVVAMSNDFPMSVEHLLNILEFITPFKHFNKLREFVEMKLPSGFPVKIELPILPTVTARVTFQEFEFRDNLHPQLFHIPQGYREDKGRFPGL
ncbi:ankyrin repeat domain-containing protein 13C-B-like isoform X2 [Varroa jacobsoni]|nr:ankyrin repeat domain-containing protein 13C-B-like isoform X2 [Varroa destructor]XP_022648415.1 ankyrin repeat domain-containing protein 13C-B-like isoform X2 [Varroa destructor]XP_022696067.1 ankyrin repeat domain-containing protein 13C-B-like isoform X2 [Varroa jacobsoni]